MMNEQEFLSDGHVISCGTPICPTAQARDTPLEVMITYKWAGMAN